MYYSSSILFDSFLEDLNHKICPLFLKKNDVRHCQPSSAKVEEYFDLVKSPRHFDLVKHPRLEMSAHKIAVRIQVP